MSHDDGKICLCSVRHQPNPLELVEHHIWPSFMGGPDVASNRVWICPTTHYNVHELLRLFVNKGFLLFPTFWEVGNLYTTSISRYAYELAAEGYKRSL